MYKKYAYEICSGTEALVIALQELKSKRVIIPSYTCGDILRAVELLKCEYFIADCGYDLQIDVEQVINYSSNYDTVIIPHMFGIRANVQAIKNNTSLKIIEDLSQCHGLQDLGAYADIVVSSTNKSKWLDFGGGGLLFSDKKLSYPLFDFDPFVDIIDIYVRKRNQLAEKILHTGVNLIGQGDSSWLRGMYFTEQAERIPYTPLHLVRPGFACPKINSYINKVDWISIHI